MPNAKDANSIAVHRILALGDTGSGKTSQILTLPGKKFAYLFDPNALLSLRGYDVDYEEILPTTVSASISSLTKGKSDPRQTTASSVYQVFYDEFETRAREGFFDQYDWLIFDSATTLLDLMMDRVLTMNGRYGQWPHEDDYGPMMQAFINLCRSLMASGKQLYMTGHLEIKQDKTSKVISNRPMMAGRLTAKIPLLFTDSFYMDTDRDEKGHVIYRLQTVPDQMNRTIRTCIKGLNAFEDITIDFANPPEGQGLGGILLWERKNLGA